MKPFLEMKSFMSASFTISPLCSGRGKPCTNASYIPPDCWGEGLWSDLMKTGSGASPDADLRVSAETREGGVELGKEVSRVRKRHHGLYKKKTQNKTLLCFRA